MKGDIVLMLMWLASLQIIVDGRGGGAPSLEEERVEPVIQLTPSSGLLTVKEGDSAELHCYIIAGNPTPEIVWLHDGQPIDTGNTLMLVDIKEETFGKYTCKATNQLGEDQRTIEISGDADEAIIKSSAKSDDASQYKLEWTVTSKTPVTEFKVQYRKKNDAFWTTMVVAASPLEDDFYTGHYEFNYLQSAAIYQVRIASSNQFGYNNFGKIFSFTTKGTSKCECMYGDADTECRNGPVGVACNVLQGACSHQIWVPAIGGYVSKIPCDGK